MGVQLGWNSGKNRLRQKRTKQSRPKQDKFKNFSTTHTEFNMREAGLEMMGEIGCVGPWWLCERNLHHPEKNGGPPKF